MEHRTVTPASTSPRIQEEPASLSRWLAGWLLARLGWRITLTWPEAPKVLVIVYPHTSNWDFFLGHLARHAWGLPTAWVGKHTIFRWPVDGLLRRMGGIPIDRAQPTGIIKALTAEYARRTTMCLAMAPEGTRSRRDHLKSGFYRLALAAKVPVGLGFIDYPARRIGLDTWIELRGDEAADLARLRDFYAGHLGRHPEQASEIRFRPERDPGGGQVKRG